MSGRVMVGLFSGLNVGGNRKVPMAELRVLLGELGLEGVSTHLQSGNTVFRVGRQTDGEVVRQVEDAFAQRFGFASRAMVREIGWLRDMVGGNSFPAEEPTKLHAFVLEHAPAAADVDALAARNTGSERFLLRGDVLYLWTPEGFGRSKFAARIPRDLKVAATARNWRTVLTLLDMAEAKAAADD